jgi:D-alanyl-D-alanine carboxypeptidase/D-alanyl-D-alanine-endopeptidase (penicillin-binding protein 4)
MARQLFLTLGATTSASIPGSAAAMRDWLTKKGLDFPELVLENGAGLSRKERISAEHMSQLLQSVTESAYSAELVASLPILGVDGSVKKRLKNSSAASHAHLKTGTLDGVKTLAGYVQAQSGKQWVVVFFINHPNAKRAQAAQDALIEWLQGQ